MATKAEMERACDLCNEAIQEYEDSLLSEEEQLLFAYKVALAVSKVIKDAKAQRVN